MIMIMPAIRKWKWHQKILYSAGLFLLMFLLHDFIELAVLYCPQNLSCGQIVWRGREYGSEKMDPPIRFSTEALSEKQRISEDWETVPMSIQATHMGIFPWHKGESPCFYHVKINRKTGQVFLARKYMTFFWGMSGPTFHEIKTMSVNKRLFEVSLSLLKELDEQNE